MNSKTMDDRRMRSSRGWLLFGRPCGDASKFSRLKAATLINCSARVEWSYFALKALFMRALIYSSILFMLEFVRSEMTLSCCQDYFCSWVRFYGLCYIWLECVTHLFFLPKIYYIGSLHWLFQSYLQSLRNHYGRVYECGLAKFSTANCGAFEQYWQDAARHAEEGLRSLPLIQ